MPARMRVALLLSSLIVAASPVLASSNWFQVDGGSWVVDEATAAAIDKDIQSSVRDLAGKGFKLFAAWDRYTFQYQGRGDGSGRFVYVNAFCSTPSDKNLTTRFVEVFDGGACFFQVKYDPTTHKFFDLSVNGYA